MRAVPYIVFTGLLLAGLFAVVAISGCASDNHPALQVVEPGSIHR